MGKSEEFVMKLIREIDPDKIEMIRERVQRQVQDQVQRKAQQKAQQRAQRKQGRRGPRGAPGGLRWLAAGLRLALVAGAVYLWWRSRQRDRLQAEQEQARERVWSGQGSRSQGMPTPPAPAASSAAGGGAQATGRAAVQTATRAEPLPGAAERMASGEAAPGGIPAAYPARPAEPPLPSVHPPAPTPQPTVLSPAGEVSAEVAPLAPAAEENKAAQPDDAPSGEDQPDDRPSGEDQPDDLEVIEGIGPRIASILREQGITTFKQLSEAPLERLQEILRTRNLRLADPTTWPEQARLAGQGDWPALTALQDTLKGGRRVSG